MQRNFSENTFEINRRENSGELENGEMVDFVTANCQVLANPTQADCDNLKNPDKPFPWEQVVSVRYFQTESAKCPICIEEFTAPRMGKCGHMYCLPCLMRYFKKDPEVVKCAVCFQPLEPQELRR